MKEQGPQLTALTHRLAQAPAEILARPQIVNQRLGIVSTAAMFSDLLFALGSRMLTVEEAQVFLEIYTASNENLLQIMQAACYLCRDEWFVERSRRDPQKVMVTKLVDLVTEGLAELSQHAKAAYFIEDPEGREELCRRVLWSLALVPLGETEAQAADRLTALDSVERAKVIDKTRAAQQRAREIREAMAKKAAEEAASKMSRE
jgi:hypothetical protein